MKLDHIVWWSFLSLYGVLYIIIYFGFSLVIHLLNSTYNLFSLAAILLRFIILILFLLVLWINLERTVDYIENVKSRLRTIAIIGIIPPLYCSIVLGINHYHSIFSTSKWMNNPSKRVFMVDDLINKYELEKKTKLEVISLLGNPTDTEYFQQDKRFVYYLGDERGLISIDSEWLIIDFDDEEKVKDYGIFTD